jgi:hypothetical protein
MACLPIPSYPPKHGLNTISNDDGNEKKKGKKKIVENELSGIVYE